jgi:quercetin dioxygenase-like cupin family protein
MKISTLMVCVIGAGIMGLVSAQKPGFTRVALQSHELSVPGRMGVQARAEFDPGIFAGRHTHPGEELGYVLEGEFELRVDGQATRVVKAGEAFMVPGNTIHDALNIGSSKGKILATYFVEKGKPVATFVD